MRKREKKKSRDVDAVIPRDWSYTPGCGLNVHTLPPIPRFHVVEESGIPFFFFFSFLNT